MDRKKRNHVTIVSIGMLILLAVWMLVSSIHGASPITLPGEKSDSEKAETPILSEETLKVAEIRPDTVQTAIQTLKRPKAYTQTIQIQQFWEGGSGSFTVQTAVRDGWSRMDRDLSGQSVRHSLTDGTTTYIWYNRDKKVYQGKAGEISSDDEQSIPTYEEILSLPVQQIGNAEFTTIGPGVECIYVETKADPQHYVNRYWVSVENGLLVAAETLVDAETIYRMSGLGVKLDLPGAESFTLPSGERVF